MQNPEPSGRATGARDYHAISRHAAQASGQRGQERGGRRGERKFLGFTFSRRFRRQVSPKAIQSLKERIREKTGRTLGRRLEVIIQDLRRYPAGWKGYFGFAEVRPVYKDLDSWIRRRLRSYLR